MPRATYHTFGCRNLYWFHVLNASFAGRPRDYCFASDPFLVGITTISGVPVLVLARSLRAAYDAFGIRQELERVLAIELSLGGMYDAHRAAPHEIIHTRLCIFLSDTDRDPMTE